MPGVVKLRWEVDSDLSAVYAAFVVASGMRCTDQKVELALRGPIDQINQRLVTASLDNARFWATLIDRSVAGDDVSLAVATALLRAGCSELQLEQIAKAIGTRLGEARQLFFRRFPKLDEQLPLRLGPLRQRWEAIGPGLLREVERLVWENSPPDDWWPTIVNVRAVQPLTGGAGGFDPDADSIWIEAMLTDAEPEIPEVLRLVWLVTSLAIETHIRSRTGQRVLSSAWSLVSVPLVLSAGVQLEMFAEDQLPIGRAVDLWHGGTPQMIATLENWWLDYRDSDVPLPKALQQLEESLR